MATVAAKKRNVLFILIASPLLYVPPCFFRLDLPQRLQGCFDLLHVTICCRWDSHIILLLTVVRSGAVAAHKMWEFYSFSQLDGGLTFL